MVVLDAACALFQWFFNSPKLPPISTLHFGHLHIVAEIPIENAHTFAAYMDYGTDRRRLTFFSIIQFLNNKSAELILSATYRY